MTVWMSHSAQCCHTTIIPPRARPDHPHCHQLTDTWRKGCDKLSNVFRIFLKLKLWDPEHVVDLVSLTNCQLECCPLPQPGVCTCVSLYGVTCPGHPGAPTYHLCSALTILGSPQLDPRPAFDRDKPLNLDFDFSD